jgi:hypothetical protein
MMIMPKGENAMLKPVGLLTPVESWSSSMTAWASTFQAYEGLQTVPKKLTPGMCV